MKAFLIKHWGSLLLIAVMGICVLLMEIFCLPANDELYYGSGGIRQGLLQVNGDPGWKDFSHINSLAGVVRQQVTDYTTDSNGRVWIHAVVAAISGARLNWVFDLVSAGFRLLLAYLLMREGGLRRPNVRTYLFILSLAWWFLWYAEPCMKNAAFAVNYLWMASFAIGMMVLWRRLRHSWWLVPIAFFFGWSQESFSAPMVVALASGMFLRAINREKDVFSPQRIVAWVAMIVGLLLLVNGCGGHGVDKGLVEWVQQGARGFVWVALSSALSLWPLVAALALCWIVWYWRRQLWSLFLHAPEWWCYLFVSVGVACLAMGLRKDMGVRLLYATLLAATILIIRERNAFPRLKEWMGRGVIGITVVWMLCVTAVQACIAFTESSMLRLYQASPDGITKVVAIPRGPFITSTYSISTSAPGAQAIEMGKPVFPHILTPWLYNTLYNGGWERFIAEAQEIVPGSGLYLPPGHTRCVVKRGEGVLTEAQCEQVRAYFKSKQKPSGIPGLILAHFAPAFPPMDAEFYMPTPCERLALADGTVVTLLSIPTLAEWNLLPHWCTSEQAKLPDGTSTTSKAVLGE